MIRKFFPAFLIIFLLVAAYSFYQKNNPTVNDVFNDVQPSISVEKSISDAKTIFLQIDQPVNNVTVSNAAVILTGKTIPNGFVFVNDQEFKADPNGNFSTKITLNEGENDIYIVVSDEFGNSAEKNIIVNLESIL